LTLFDIDVVNLTLFDVSFVTINVRRLHKNQSRLHHHHHHYQRSNPSPVFIASEYAHIYRKIQIRMHSVFRKGSHFVVEYKFVYTHTHTHTSIILIHFLFFVLKLVYKRWIRKRKTSRMLMSIHTCRLSVINSKIGWSAQRPICVYMCIYICTESIQSHWTASVRSAKKKNWCVTRLFIKISNHKHTLTEFVLIYTSMLSLPVMSSFFFFLSLQR